MGSRALSSPPQNLWPHVLTQIRASSSNHGHASLGQVRFVTRDSTASQFLQCLESSTERPQTLSTLKPKP